MTEELVRVWWVMYETTSRTAHYTAGQLTEEKANADRDELLTRAEVQTAVVNFADIPRSVLEIEGVVTP